MSDSAAGGWLLMRLLRTSTDSCFQDGGCVPKCVTPFSSVQVYTWATAGNERLINSRARKRMAYLHVTVWENHSTLILAVRLEPPAPKAHFSICEVALRKHIRPDFKQKPA